MAGLLRATLAGVQYAVFSVNYFCRLASTIFLGSGRP